MSFIPITNRREIHAAFSQLCRELNRGGQPLRRKVGWQGGNKDCRMVWNPRTGVWSAADQWENGNRHVLWLGDTDPRQMRMVPIVCEINPPHGGINRRCAGAFVRDSRGRIFITHSGKIGGGGQGIGKQAFRRFYRGTWETANWPDGKNTEVILIGQLGTRRLPFQVAHFVAEVKRFKTAVRSGSLQQAAPRTTRSFSPEFSGRRRGYRVRREIEGQCDHGVIITALANALQNLGFLVANDQNRDLYIVGRAGGMKTLFEAKTSVTTSTIYQAIGQLLFHAGAQTPRPGMVLILPKGPKSETRTRLSSLDIEVLTYAWAGDQPTFSGLARLLETMGVLRP